MGLPGGRGSPIERRDRDSWSGRVPKPSPAAGSVGGQHGQPAGEHQGSGQDSEGSQEPAGCPAGFVRRWGGHLGGCPAGDGGALSGQLPPVGGVRGGLLP
jgi:hypothetical protein